MLFRSKDEVDRIADKYKGKKADGGKVEKVMHEFKHGALHSGSKTGPVVTNRDQAIAIAMSEAGKSKKKTRRAGKKHRRMADGGEVKFSREWYIRHGIRPRAGDQGPAPKKVEGNYAFNKKEKEGKPATSGTSGTLGEKYTYLKDTKKER